MANLITIEQLLESVDLDFEPRFVTKDKSGVIAIWSEKPEKVVASRAWVGQTEFVVIHLIKLADFENKDWQDCIYEVSRKPDYIKWIGKLCRFWDGDKNCFDYGILKRIDEGTYITSDNAWYYHCAPVRPDDDVIYKDAVNELKGA